MCTLIDGSRNSGVLDMSMALVISPAGGGPQSRVKGPKKRGWSK
jgi:hypothetical protein